MIKLSTVLQEPIEVEVDGKVLKFSYLTLGDYKSQSDFVEIAFASLKKLHPETTREFVATLPVDSDELTQTLIEVGGLSKAKGASGGEGSSSDPPPAQTG